MNRSWWWEGETLYVMWRDPQDASWTLDCVPSKGTTFYRCISSCYKKAYADMHRAGGKYSFPLSFATGGCTRASQAEVVKFLEGL